MSSQFLKIEYQDNIQENFCDYNYRNTPFLAEKAEIISSSITGVKLLTSVKKVYQISLDLKNVKLDFKSGDTIALLPQNDPNHVESLLRRLNLKELANKSCKLTVSPSKTLPRHLPPETSLQAIFSHHVDLQTPPKKLFLKSLITFTQNTDERKNLEQLTSTDFTKFIGQNLLSVLKSFPSCNPPVEFLLQYLSPLLPRPYSICSSQALNNNIEITFFVVQREDGSRGVCTGFLQDIIEKKCENSISFYLRESSSFQLPIHVNVPLILIATGTGIAPFRGFLQSLGKPSPEEIWLFYGCRNRDEFLFQEEIQASCLKKLVVCFSRTSEKKDYVQDGIERNKNGFLDLVEKGARIYICGDFKTVVKDVKQYLTSIGVECEGRIYIDTWF